MAEAARHIFETKDAASPAKDGRWLPLTDASAARGRPLNDMPSSCRTLIERAVTAEVVPRLMSGRCHAVAGSDIEEFVELLLSEDRSAPAAYAECILAEGLTADALFLDLLAPAARHMGLLWNDDALDFTRLSIGLTRLRHLLWDFEPAFQISDEMSSVFPLGRRQALLMATPGEQHNFGIAMVTAFFRRAGWAICNGGTVSGSELNHIVRRNWFEVAGFSLAAEIRLEALRNAIRTVRQASQNPCIRIMVGGPLFLEYPALVAEVGADAMAVDGRRAVIQAESLLMLPRCC